MDEVGTMAAKSIVMDEVGTMAAWPELEAPDEHPEFEEYDEEVEAVLVDALGDLWEGFPYDACE